MEKYPLLILLEVKEVLMLLTKISKLGMLPLNLEKKSKIIKISFFVFQERWCRNQ